VFTLMTTWQRGRQIVTANRREKEGPLTDFIDKLQRQHILRVPGTAVFPHPSKDSTPLALRANVEHNGVLHEHVVIFSTEPKNIPHVAAADQVSIDHLGSSSDGIVHVTLRYGFFDEPNIPEALGRHSSATIEEFDVDPATASYFLSRATLRRTNAPGMRRWRKMLFITLAHNAANPAVYFGLPEDQTVVMGSHIDL
jgi:KUP system potassium uptake protein